MKEIYKESKFNYSDLYLDQTQIRSATEGDDRLAILSERKLLNTKSPDRQTVINFLQNERESQKPPVQNQDEGNQIELSSDPYSNATSQNFTSGSWAQVQTFNNIYISPQLL